MGLLIGIIALVIILVVVGTGVFLLTKNKGATLTNTTTNQAPANLHITPYIYHGLADEVISAAWSPDGKRIAAGGFDNTVQVWDAVTGHELLTF